LAVFSIPVAFAADKHVRVDIVRQSQNFDLQRRTDFIGIFVFAFPVFILLLVYVWGDVIYSIKIGEGSPQIGGLPFFFLIKAGLPLACILMMVQGLAITFGVNNKIGKPS
jgi:TRAP-type mannitol/chloroaromatic compound transport system permease small subunit